MTFAFLSITEIVRVLVCCDLLIALCAARVFVITLFRSCDQVKYQIAIVHRRAALLSVESKKLPAVTVQRAHRCPNELTSMVYTDRGPS